MERLTIRGFQKGKLIFWETVELDKREMLEQLPIIAERHVKQLGSAPHMIEFEFLDEPEINQRFLRIGTEATGMVNPAEIDFTKWRLPR